MHIALARPFTDRSTLRLVLAAPVIGHAFPLFHPRMGGKAIAVSFGCLLGLYPDLRPVLTLAAFYLIFSLLLVIDPSSFPKHDHLSLPLSECIADSSACSDPLWDHSDLYRRHPPARSPIRKRTITDPSAETEPLMVLFSFSMPLRSFSDITPSSPAAYPLDSHFR